MLAIETRDLTKRFRGRSVLSGVELRVPERCVYGFLGPNGAGKTTTMRLLVGLLRPDAGRILIFGNDVAQNRLAALAMVGAFVESPALYEHLSGRQNLDLTRRLLALDPREIDRVLEVVDLAAPARDRVKDYSLGMKQRLAVARALLGSPKVLLLDEPTNGLDPDGIVAMRELVRALPERIGGTVFVSSHLLAEVEQVADFAGIMREGHLILQGKVGEILGHRLSLQIVVDDAEAGVALLKAQGMDAYAVDAEQISLSCGDSDPRTDAARANSILVGAGHAVSALTPQARTLENAYREAVARDWG